jgi:2-keto-3-deoxy-L-rhamnonate aldolase RhmA
MSPDFSKLAESDRDALISLVRSQPSAWFALLHRALAISQQDWTTPALATIEEARRAMDLCQTWATGVRSVEVPNGVTEPGPVVELLAGIVADVRVQMAEFDEDLKALDQIAN